MLLNHSPTFSSDSEMSIESFIGAPRRQECLDRSREALGAEKYAHEPKHLGSHSRTSAWVNSAAIHGLTEAPTRIKKGYGTVARRLDEDHPHPHT